MLISSSWFKTMLVIGQGYVCMGGGTDLERGYGDVRPWRPPFHASPVVHKGPISSKGSQFTRPPFETFLKF